MIQCQGCTCAGWLWEGEGGLGDHQPGVYVPLKALFLVSLISRSVGTFARALDCTSTVRQPSLHMSAAAASRDITLVSIHSFNMSRDARKPVFGVSDQVRHKPVFTVTEDG